MTFDLHIWVIDLEQGPVLNLVNGEKIQRESDIIILSSLLSFSCLPACIKWHKDRLRWRLPLLQ